MSLTVETSIDQALARGTVYQCLAQACYYPSPAFAEALARGLWLSSLREALESLPDLAALQPHLATLQDLAPVCDLAELRSELTRLFSNTAVTDFPPYGANYLASHIFMKAQTLADVAGFYRAFGVDIASSTERPDHVSVELEFMGYLCLKQAYAIDHSLTEAEEVTSAAQRRFFAEHLGRWAPLFLSRFAARSAQPFYRALAAFARAFLGAEKDRLGGSIEAIDELPADTPAPSDFTCGSSAGQCPTATTAEPLLHLTLERGEG
jgi:DMSO reductase family type II enzyme chaperone